jgi:glyoxylase-like metal-dependent hydrolase (beta-lactamase superfamily II)
MPDFLEVLGDGVHAIDTGYQRARFDAAYLIVEAGRAAFIDTGTNYAVPRLLQALSALGLARDCVDWVIPTHVHLDHAGGVGTLMRELPNARLLVHPRGLRHLVDPRVLWAGAMAVYGEAEMQRSYGARLIPVPAERAEVATDGQQVQLAGRELAILDTPGHARHHICIWDARSRGMFTGDTFGLSYREFDTAQGPWILPTSSPVQFEPEAMKESLARILAHDPQWLYLTHYNRVGEAQRLGRLMVEQIDATVALCKPLRDAPDRHERIKTGLEALYLERLRAHGCTLPPEEQRRLLAMDVELNALGLEIWLDRPDKPA